MPRLILTGPLLLLSLASGFAQEFRPGFIIKLEGDSVPGLISYRNAKLNTEACYFKTSSRNKKAIYLPGQIKGYGFVDDKYYETRTLPVQVFQGKVGFVEMLMKGKMNLMKYNDVFLVEKDSIYVLVNSSKTVQVEGRDYLRDEKKYVGILNYLMTDCGLKADATKYEDRPLINLVRNYNKCQETSIIEYKAKIPWTRSKVGVFGSADFSMIKLEGFQDFSVKSSRSLVGGLSIDLFSPRIYDKAFLSFEMWYVKKLYQGYSQSTDLGSITRSDLLLNASFLKVPLGIGYNLLRNGNTPYVKFGFAEYFWLNKPTAVIISETESQGVVITEKKEQALSSRITTGIWFAAGYTQTTFTRFSGFVELRYENNFGLITSLNQSLSSSQSYNLIVGLKF